MRQFQGSCYNLLLTYDDSLTIKLTSWEELTVSKLLKDYILNIIHTMYRVWYIFFSNQNLTKLYLYLFQKESTESFCPKHVKIGLSMGNVGLVYDYPKKRIKETPTYTLKFEKVSSENCSFNCTLQSSTSFFVHN